MSASHYQTGSDAWALDEWQNWFAEIYGRRNRTCTPQQVWYRQLEEIGELLKLARSAGLEAFRDALPDIPAWLFAFCDVSGISVEEAVWNQFRDGCPWCAAKEHCTCIYDYPVKRHAIYGPTLFAAKRDLTLGGWVQLFDKLYGQVYRRHDLLILVTYLQETAGVIAKTCRTRRPTLELQADVANFFAWAVGVYIRYKSIVLEDSTFAQLIIGKYANCPKCRHRPCTCRQPVESVLVGLSPADEFDESVEREITRFAEAEGLEYSFAHLVGGLAEQVRHARRADALALIVSKSMPTHLESLYHIAAEYGKEVGVLTVGSPEDDRLVNFVETVRQTGALLQVKEGQLLTEVSEWLANLPRSTMGTH